MIYAHKLLPLLLSPIFLLILLIAYGGWFGRRNLCMFAVVLLYGLSTPIIANPLFRLVEGYSVKSMPAQQSSHDAIVVLSGMLTGVLSANGVVTEWEDPDRFFAGVELYKAGKSRTLIFTQGLLPWSIPQRPEGEILRRFALELGVPDNAIKLTRRVQNTHEEAKAARALLPANQASIILVTSAFHMPRAQLIFEQAGFRVHPYPVDFKITSKKMTPMDFLPQARALLLSSTAIRELLGRGYYQIFPVS